MIALLNLGFTRRPKDGESDGKHYFRHAEFNLDVRVAGTDIYIKIDDIETLTTLDELEAYVEGLI